ncbi:MAG TPA: hypothetical protein VEC12_03685 [Bacteroidia bacterium]|nr:hypothetical protein [Bacteroidia bacterium]
MVLINILLIIPAVYAFMVVNTLLHEMGHAIVLWLFTKQPVNIYIGSYGDKNAYKFKIKSFNFFIAKQPLNLYYGMCDNNLYGPAWKLILMFASGPVFAFLFAAAVFYYPFFNAVPEWVYEVTFYFVIYTALSLLYNLTPHRISQNFDSRGVNNDGSWIAYYLKVLFKKPDFKKKHQHLTELWILTRKDDYLTFFGKYYEEGFRDTVLLNTAFAFSFDAGKFSDALKYLTDLEKQKKLNETHYYFMGYSQYAMGKTDDAIVSCDKALTIRPGYGSALSLKTEIYLSKNNHEELKKIELLAEKHADAPLNALLLAKIAYNTGRLKQAIRYINNVSVGVISDNFELFTYKCLCNSKLGNATEAKEYFNHPSVMNDSDNHCINISLIHLNLGECKEAIEFLLNVLDRNNENHYALNNMSHALNILGRHEEAIDYADKGIAVNPDMYYCYSNKAFAELMLGRLEDGWQTNLKAAELNPYSSYVLRNTGIYYKGTGDVEKAKEYFTKSYHTDPTTHKLEELANSIGIELLPVED